MEKIENAKLWLTGKSKTIDWMKINRWMKELSIKVKGFVVNDDFSIDIDGDFNIEDKKISELPFRINNIKGSFIANKNGFTNLNGFPNVIWGDFECSENKLESLIGMPEIHGNINVRLNALKKLDGIQTKVLGNLDCSGNKITSLKNSPTVINGVFNCSKNKIKNLDYCPIVIEKDFDCSGNKISSLENSPEVIGGNLICIGNKIETLRGFNKLYFNGSLNMDNNKELISQDYIKETFPSWEATITLNSKSLNELVVKMEKSGDLTFIAPEKRSEFVKING